MHTSVYSSQQENILIRHGSTGNQHVKGGPCFVFDINETP